MRRALARADSRAYTTSMFGAFPTFAHDYAVLAGFLPQEGVLGAAGPIAAAQRDHLFAIFGWMMIVIAPVFVVLPWLVWKYRIARVDPEGRPGRDYSSVIEHLIWAVPGIIVAILSWNLWHETRDLDPYKPIAAAQPPLLVEVVGLDWKWLFIYPEQGVASVGELVIPAGRPVTFRLTSDSVMQSFMIPRLGGQIYTMPGMVTQLNLLASETGEFPGLNAQYSGIGTPQQRFVTRSVSVAEFDGWVGRARASGNTLDTPAYAVLSDPSTLSSTVLYSSVAPGQFERIVSSYTGGTALGEAP